MKTENLFEGLEKPYGDGDDLDESQQKQVDELTLSDDDLKGLSDSEKNKSEEEVKKIREDALNKKKSELKDKLVSEKNGGKQPTQEEFNKLWKRFKDTQEKLGEYEKKEKEKAVMSKKEEEERLKKNQEHEALIEKLQKERDELLSSNENEKARSSTYEKALETTLESLMERIPKEKQTLIPEDYDPAQRLAFISKNEKLLMNPGTTTKDRGGDGLADGEHKNELEKKQTRMQELLDKRKEKGNLRPEEKDELRLLPMEIQRLREGAK